jgi:hypothetical protein
MEKSRWLSKVGTWIFICIAFWLIALLLLFASVSAWRKEREAARASLELYHAQQRQKISDLHFYGTLKQAFAVMIPAIMLVSGAAVAIGLARRKQIVMVKVGKHSEFPVHYRQIQRGELAQQLTALCTAEELKLYNAGINKAFEIYAALADSQAKLLRATPARAALPAAAPAMLSEPGTLAPRFADLLRSGDIAPGKPLIFGFAKGAPRVGTWQDIYSNATGGQSGKGKTATLRSLIGQSVLQGVIFWIADWHYPHEKSLLTSLGALKDTDSIQHDFDLMDMLKDIEGTIERRKRQEEPSNPVKVFCVDELFRVNEAQPKAGKIVEVIGTEGRKFNVFGLFSATSWSARKVGGSTARDNLTSIFAHCMKPNQADLLLQDKALTKICSHLRTGQMLFCPANAEPEVLTVPFCDPRDMDTVFEMLPPRHAIDQPLDLTRPGEWSDIDRVNDLIKTGKITQKQLSIDLHIDPSFLSKILRGEKPAPERIREALTQL